MRARDLMIGDYISVKPSGMPIKVAAVHHKKVAYHAIISRLAWVREGLLEPIPLIPKILEKNGFESQHDVGYVLRHYDDNTIIVDLWNHTLKILMNYKVVFEKEYFDIIPLHELQHAMHLCGIEKEITL